VARPELGKRERVRVELRLPQASAEALYQCARDWNLSLSEAGARLIDLGYATVAQRAAVSEVVAHPVDHIRETQGH
jgi:hypothetical protein